MSTKVPYKQLGTVMVAVGSVAVSIRLFQNWQCSRVIARWVNSCRTAFGELSLLQRQGVVLIVEAYFEYIKVHELNANPYQLAYILATAWHECSIESVREQRFNYVTQPAEYANQTRYWKTGYYGRGYPQLTWINNYYDMSELFGVDFVENPDLVLDPQYSAPILVWGMMRGDFGHALTRHINDQKTDLPNARRSVNGTDDMHEVANHARHLLDIMGIATS